MCSGNTNRLLTEAALLQALARFGRAVAEKLMRSPVHEVPQCTGRTFCPLERILGRVGGIVHPALDSQPGVWTTKEDGYHVAIMAKVATVCFDPPQSPKPAEACGADIAKTVAARKAVMAPCPRRCRVRLETASRF